MPHVRDAKVSSFKRILAVGGTGTGKTTQLWTLPGRKFLYQFDPNTMASIKGLADQLKIEPPDIEFEAFEPDILQLDSTLKGFRKDAKDDNMSLIGRNKKDAEPTVYLDFVEDINKRVDEDYFRKNDISWLCFDSLTFLNRATMARNLYINDHYGFIEDLADYRVVGSKIAELFTSIVSLPINIYMTAHWQSYQDDKTKKIETKINAHGSSRTMLPLVFTEIFQTVREEIKGQTTYSIRTRPDPRGLQDLRTSILGLEELEDVTIDDFSRAKEFGIGAILEEHSKKEN